MSTQEQASDNMQLWSEVCETNPAHIKKVEKRGGYLTITAQQRIKRATQLWGPYGKDWGIRNLEYIYLKDGSGEIREVALEGEFFCPISMFESSVDTLYKAGNNVRRKLATSLITKSLARLGFNSDVSEGLHDHPAYKELMRKKFAPAEKPTKEQLKNLTPTPKAPKKRKQVHQNRTRQVKISERNSWTKICKDHPETGTLFKRLNLSVVHGDSIWDGCTGTSTMTPKAQFIDTITLRARSKDYYAQL